MGVSKLMIFLMISMAVVSVVRCLDDEFEEIGNVDPTNGTTEPDKKGFKECVKEKVKKVVDKGKELIKGAGDAISRGYNAVKDKLGKKQPDSLSTSTPVPVNQYPPSQNEPQYPPSGAFPQPPPEAGSSYPGVLPSSSQGREQSDITFNQPSQTQDDVELLDPRQRFNRK